MSDVTMKGRAVNCPSLGDAQHKNNKLSISTPLKMETNIPKKNISILIDREVTRKWVV